MVRKACLSLGIEPLGTHALRAADAQRTYDAEIEAGVGERAARQTVAERLGHHRTDVTHQLRALNAAACHGVYVETPLLAMWLTSVHRVGRVWASLITLA